VSPQGYAYTGLNTTDLYDACCRAETSHDVWQFGIVIFVCLTGCLPWQKAGNDDPRYSRYLHWHGSTGVLMPVRRPKLFKLLTSRAQRMFRKFLEPRPEKRPGGLADLAKFLEDRWLTRTSLDRQTGVRRDPYSGQRLAPSLYDNGLTN
jgi:serine/threonine-protein kinase SBK